VKRTSLVLALIAVTMVWPVIGALAAQVPPDGTVSEPAEDEVALAKLAAQELAYRARIDARLAKYRSYLVARNFEMAYEVYLEVERLRDEISAKYLLYIAEHPQSAEAYNLLGLLSFDVGRSLDARAYWQKAIELKPDFAEAHNNLATFYGHFGQPKESLKELRKAIEIDPKQAVFHINLATEYYTSRQHTMELYGWDLPKVFQEVLNEHRIARELEPHNYDYAKQYAETFYGAKYFETKPDWEESIRGWYRCLETDLTKENRVHVYYQIARAHLQMHDQEKARKILEGLEPWMKDSAQFAMLWKRATEPEPTQSPHKDSGE